jgi:hypothetical protein
MVEIKLEYFENEQWLEKTISLDLEKDMSLSDETLDQDMQRLPMLIAYYAEMSAELQAQASRHEQQYKRVEAQLAQALRAGVKTTENSIKEQVLLEDNARDMRFRYYDSVKQHSMVEGFYRALREKTSLSIALCYKQKEEIRVSNSSLH